MKKRGFLTVLVLILVIFTAGCQLRRTPDETVEEKIYTGTEGLSIKLMNNLPPSKIYDSTSLNIVAELENKGVSDLTGSNCVIHAHGYDSNIVRGIDRNQYCGSNLFEKSVSYPQGGLDTVEFKAGSIRLPEGIDSLPQKFILTSCYDYETFASPVVCVDPQLFKIRAIEEACTVKDISLGGGQGAPVAVDRVEVDMVSENKVAFKIHVSNVGGGTVLRPGVNLLGCLDLNEYDDYNIVAYDIDMSGGSMINCAPREIRLVDNKATLFCTFRVSGDYAYTTPLQINLRYGYLDSISKNVEIIKTPE